MNCKHRGSQSRVENMQAAGLKLCDADLFINNTDQGSIYRTTILVILIERLDLSG